MISSPNPNARHVFITGGTGYIGSRLIIALLARGHRVRALVRAGSEPKLPQGCEIIVGHATRADSFANAVAPCDTFVQLVGVPHPSPRKAKLFRAIDLNAALAGAAAARESGIGHFVYLSVAQPAPVMKAYIAARAEAEARICTQVSAGHFAATFLRPWYVLGPGHRWPWLLLPLYKLLELIPATGQLAHRMGLVSIDQMVSALVHAIEQPAVDVRVIDVPGIRRVARLV